MRKKYFIVSDVHGFYDELMRGLDVAGFDINNKNHIFVSLGDLFDRGSKSYECLQFVNSLPENRKILIRGNHETLMQEAISRRYFKWHDSHNMTDETCVEFYKKTHCDNIDGIHDDDILSWMENWDELNKYFNSLKFYYILNDNLFVHGWVPYWCRTLTDVKKSDAFDWYDAAWENPFQMWYEGGNIRTSNRKGSRLVTVFCGHVHSYYGYIKLRGIKATTFDDYNFSPFIDEGIVNLDSCTAKSGIVNVNVL